MMGNIVARRTNYERIKKANKGGGSKLSLQHLDSLELLEIIKQDISTPVIFDIGANIGTWARLALAVFPDSTLECFEPLPSHISKFHEEFRNSESVQLHTVALGASNKKGSIHITSLSDASSLLDLSDICKSKYNLSVKETISIDVKKLDDYIIDNGLKSPDVIKLDIQGFELEALKGASETLKTTKFIISEVSFIEFYNGQAYFSDMIDFLKRFGFELAALSRDTPTGKTLEQTDVLFKRLNQHAKET